MKIICSGDMHLDGTRTPICRTDNFYDAQVRALEFVNKITRKHKATRIDAGDIIDVAVGKSVSDAVKTQELIMRHIDKLYAILGNHCLKNKSLQYLTESTIYTPIVAGNIIHVTNPIMLPDSNVMLHGFNFGQSIEHLPKEMIDDGNVHIALYHGFVDEVENKLIGGLIAKDIVREFQEYSWIVTADHHKAFTYTEGNTTLINTGSLMRTTVNQIDFKPRVWLIDTETKEFEPIYLPIEDGVISKEHIEIQKDREERMISFVETMDQEYELTEMFEKNIEKYIAKNKYGEEGELLINVNVENFINIAMEGRE